MCGTWRGTWRGLSRHTCHARPPLVVPAPDTDWVTGPNQLWDWDVTVLRSPDRWAFWYLYGLLDHFSRKDVAWHVAGHAQQ
ncbi:MAG: hypothetical protein NTU91_13170 [Chloroflexi bacterium]|nr:hypothetical protein [Chloroflexota bacterium]